MRTLFGECGEFVAHALDKRGCFGWVGGGDGAQGSGAEVRIGGARLNVDNRCEVLLVAKAAGEALRERDGGEVGEDDIAVHRVVGAANADGDGGLWRGKGAGSLGDDRACGPCELRRLRRRSDGTIDPAKNGGGELGGASAIDIAHDGDLHGPMRKQPARPMGQAISAELVDLFGGKRRMARVVEGKQCLGAQAVECAEGAQVAGGGSGCGDGAHVCKCAAVWGRIVYDAAHELEGDGQLMGRGLGDDADGIVGDGARDADAKARQEPLGLHGGVACDGWSCPECDECARETSGVDVFVDFAARDGERNCDAARDSAERADMEAHAAIALGGEDLGGGVDGESCDAPGRGRLTEDVIGDWLRAGGRGCFLERGAHASLDGAMIGSDGIGGHDEVACPGGVELCCDGMLELVVRDRVEEPAGDLGFLGGGDGSVAPGDLFSEAVGEGRGAGDELDGGALQRCAETGAGGGEQVFVETVLDGAAEFRDCFLGEGGPGVGLAHEQDGGHAEGGAVVDGECGAGSDRAFLALGEFGDAIGEGREGQTIGQACTGVLLVANRRLGLGEGEDLDGVLDELWFLLDGDDGLGRGAQLCIGGGADGTCAKWAKDVFDERRKLLGREIARDDEDGTAWRVVITKEGVDGLGGRMLDVLDVARRVRGDAGAWQQNGQRFGGKPG